MKIQMIVKTPVGTFKGKIAEDCDDQDLIESNELASKCDSLNYLLLDTKNSQIWIPGSLVKRSVITIKVWD